MQDSLLLKKVSQGMELNSGTLLLIQLKHLTKILCCDYQVKKLNAFLKKSKWLKQLPYINQLFNIVKKNSSG